MSENHSSSQLRFIRPDWSAPAWIQVASTTRQGGLSQAPYDSLNLGHHVSDKTEHVMANRQRVAEALELPAEPRWLEQVHGCDIWEFNPDSASLPQADASICRAPNQVLSILTADCLPLVLVDAKNHVAATVHCGWRGLAAGIIDNTINAMGGDPHGFVAWLGPAIGAECFEVGDEVWDAFVAKDWQMAKCFSATAAQSFNADIYAIATMQLHKIGVREVSGGRYCTVTDAALFYSYRRDGPTGRMATIAWMTPDAVPR